MCIIIDTNVLASVFKTSSADHASFKPVRDWVIDGKGKIVFGGTQYIEEIKQNYLSFFLQLKKAGKAVLISKELVDAEQLVVEGMIVHPDFDDPHLVGLLRISKCKLICSLDSRAYPFFRHSQFFAPAANRPKIYSSPSNVDLLCDRNIAELCRPCSITTNQQRALIG
jgi:predicted nucleic acid-binding protein